MDGLTFALLVVTVLLVYIAITFRRKDRRRLPPCPVTPLPFVGNLLALSHDLRPQFKQWRKQCGDIFSLYIGSQLIVVLNGFETIKEILLKRANDFSDRPVTSFDTLTGYKGKGVITSSGSVWKEHRTLTLLLLGKFGHGKNLMAEKIQEEVSHYLGYLSGYNGQPVNIQRITNMSTSNVICSILFGQRFQYTDPKFQTLISCIGGLFKYFYLNSFVDFMPALAYLPGDLFKVKLVESEMKQLFEFFREKVEECKLDKSRESLILAYLKEQHKREKTSESTTMDGDNLVKLVFDLFIASSETTPSTIDWFVIYMVNFPDIQEKIFLEINETVGSNRSPTIQDKAQLPLLHAATLEAQRLSSITANAFFHSCSADTDIRGYTIPKGSFVIPCLDSVQHDEAVWGPDVLSFRPDRFLDQDGKVKVPEEFIPFSIGRRECVGESFAYVMLFIYLSNMLQMFQLLPADPDNPPSLTKYTYGLTVTPQQYSIRLVPRK